MKYFTREQHDRANSADRLEMAAFQEELRRSDLEYRDQLEKLKARLSNAWPFFDTVSLHDGTLLAARIGDDIDKLFSTYSTLIVNKRHLSVELEVLNREETQLHRLRYDRLHRVMFDFPSPEPWYLRYSDRASNPIDYWMFDELTAVDDQVLRHEMQFSSGTTLLVEFEKFDVRSTQIEGRHGLPYVEEP
jgi:hypothetical protein